jgi:tagatose 1,6-diphosphate aldolase GatY/KbaY
MPLVSTAKMLLDAQAGGYAVGAFNIDNMEMAQAVVSAAEELQTPVIIQTTPSTVRYGGLRLYYSIVASLAAETKIPIAMHLDHGESFGLAMQALKERYTSLMIDGSLYSFEDNIALTLRVVEEAKPAGIPVEAELGMVGGKEDDADTGESGYTNPAEAQEFVKRTGISSLAVAIGTAHGPYAVPPKLDIERLRRIRSLVPVPLVLHGASGLSDAQLCECIKEGICKVNFATELRYAYSEGVRDSMTNFPVVFDPKKHGAAGRERVKQVVMEKIRICVC